MCRCCFTLFNGIPSAEGSRSIRGLKAHLEGLDAKPIQHLQPGKLQAGSSPAQKVLSWESIFVCLPCCICSRQLWDRHQVLCWICLAMWFVTLRSQSMILEMLLFTKDVHPSDYFSRSKHARNPRVVFNWQVASVVFWVCHGFLDNNKPGRIKPKQFVRNCILPDPLIPSALFVWWHMHLHSVFCLFNKSRFIYAG